MVLVRDVSDPCSGTQTNDVKITLDSETVELKAGTAAIGKLAANSGVDIGDVDVTSFPGSAEADIGNILTAVQVIDNFISGTKGLVTEDNSGDIKTAVDGLAQTTPTAYNIAISAGSTQYSQALPANTRAIEFRSRLKADVIYSFTDAKVAGPTAPYLTLDGGLQYYKEGLNLTSKTLYVAGTAGDVVELLVWS